jgi:tRNA U34 5-methylaminomethyl-2-thiouridine-forming methyltransferase MnmC
MKRFEIQTTEDGSLTIYDTLFNETFHSKYGARSESEYVFIEQGLKKFLDVSEINILEIGFGTRMNTLLTLLNKPIEQKIYYEAIELFPLQQELVELYSESLPEKELYLKLMKAKWDEEQAITPNFILFKRNENITKLTYNKNFNLIYFDAFSPKTQPELWSVEVFEQIYKHSHPGSAIVTYASSGVVKQNLRNAGFIVERLPGPPHKHHMVRGYKI